MKNISLGRGRHQVPDATIEFHPTANIFPLMEGIQFREFVEDIRMHGLRDPIVLHQGMILDGRNRYRACHAAQVAARFETYHGKDPLAYVVSANLHRRHLDASQRALIAAEIAYIQTNPDRRGPPRKAGVRDRGGRLLRPIKNPGSEQRMGRPLVHPADASRTSGVGTEPKRMASLEAACELMNVSDATVRDAKHVLVAGAPELIAAVRAGEASVTAAKELAKLPIAQQQKILKSDGAKGVRVLGRQVLRDRLGQRRLRRAAAGESSAAVFDHFKVGEGGRGIGNVAFGEAPGLAKSLMITVEVLMIIANHYANPDPGLKIRDGMKEDVLSEIIAKAQARVERHLAFKQEWSA